uniref:WRKY19-like zinc finger domain-containing protein n=1 Tax=Timema monikensis TaxID=170555 RepID=A0A7R9ECP5_9NEOP|nr:unnamed protein product [Timema monikensis]
MEKEEADMVEDATNEVQFYDPCVGTMRSIPNVFTSKDKYKIQSEQHPSLLKVVPKSKVKESFERNLVSHGGIGPKCKAADCPKSALKGGFCMSHGGIGRICKVEGCLKNVRLQNDGGSLQVGYFSSRISKRLHKRSGMKKLARDCSLKVGYS